MSVPDAPPLAGPVVGMGQGSAVPGPAAAAPNGVEVKSANPKPLAANGAVSQGTGAAPSASPGLSNIQPVHIKKTLMILNNFVINTTDFANKFAVLCERRLNKISQSIQRLEIVLAILEAKLNSIEWLAGAGGAAPQPTPVAQPAAPAAGANGAAPPGAAQPSGVEGTPASTSDVKQGAPEPKPAGPPLQDDPRYRTYFKMLKLGVPKQQLRLKMQSEGVDPNIIDLDPEAPAPPAGDDGEEGGGDGGGGDGGAKNAADPGGAGDAANGAGGGQLVRVENAGSGSDTD